ncbi:MAG TPA: GNAT family N-acetyltransferase [Terracidiphilus sp.]|nr:GNAT family N-acetyltransferase [Terracidiphilus sp.]
MHGAHLLDNPIWNALNTEHASLALGDRPARRYPPAIGPLSGTVDQTEASFEALRPLAGPKGIVVLFLTEPSIPRSGWTEIRGGELMQMVCTPDGDSAPAPLSKNATMRLLSRDDVPAMVALAELTEPGPFRERTSELGIFVGIFEGQRLVAMAGQRMHLPGFVEVSAVCTHPDARGRGYARVLIAEVMAEIRRRGETPFLHVLPDNPAIRVYEGLGYEHRRRLHLSVIRNDR